MEIEVADPFTSDELAPVEVTQPIESEMQFDDLEPQPDNMELTPSVASEARPLKRRGRKSNSNVWEHFTIETSGDGSRRALCKQCKQSFSYSTGAKVVGTSHLKRHVDKGTCSAVLRSQGGKHSATPFSLPSKMTSFSRTPKKRYRTESVPLVAVKADWYMHKIAKMIIMHDYPLHIVEDPGFLAFVRSLQPNLDMVTFNTLQGECVTTYLKEKQSVQIVVDGMPGRVCLTLDLWSSSHTTGYMFVTGQFVDSDWKLHRRLLNVIMEPYPDSDTAFSHSVAACLSDWGLVGKLFSVTVNQQLSEAAIDNLRALLTVDKSSVLEGQLLVGNCLARSMSGIIMDAYASVHGIIKKVRESVRYVKTSESREEKFLELKQQLQVPTSKFLAIDDQTKWNATYEMLLAASELKEVFSCLDASDPDYMYAPSAEDWNQIERLCSFLKPFFDTANLLTTSAVLATNTFFHEAWKIKLELARAAASEDPFVSNLAKSMQEKFDQYWNSCCFILAAAVVMDPRFKMKLIEFSFSKIYNEESATYVKIVDDGIHGLFNEYATRPLKSTAADNNVLENGITIKPEDPQEARVSSNGDIGLSDFDAYIMETTSHLAKSELDQYLQESLLPRVHEFDVIGWWKLNRTKYPTLSEMAHDVLSVPMCTVPASSVFDAVHKEMDSYRCSLRPETVEALICAKNWLMQSKNAGNPNQVVKMEVPI